MRKSVSLAFIALALSTAHAQSIDQAKTFLDRIYYWDTLPGADDPLADAKAYTPSLIKLFRNDTHKAGKGYVGKIDFDPLCDCQDPAGTKATFVSLKKISNVFAQAEISLAYPDRSTSAVTLDLLWTSRGWRIDDTHSTKTPSLCKLIH